MVSVEVLIAEMIKQEGNHTPLTLELTAAFMRQAYAHGYSDALQNPAPDLPAAQERAREAWARLPV